MTPKFEECTKCRFFSKKFNNPICGECGIGEFFEPKSRNETLSDDELMSLYERMHRDDD